MMYWGDGGFGLMGVVWFLAMAAFWILIAVGVILVVRAIVNSGKQQGVAGTQGQPQAPVVAQPSTLTPTGLAQSGPGGYVAPISSEALRILEERYARGEIDREEFLQRKVDLLS